MNPLNLKLFRDLWHSRGQVIAIIATQLLQWFIDC